MKKEFSLPLASVLGGAAALVLRLLQLHTGFEAGTGLAIPGNPAGIALVVLLLLLAVLFCALTRYLPKEEDPGPAFPADFSTSDARLLTLPVMGVFLIAVSGLLDLAAAFGISVSLPPASPDVYEDAAAVLTAGFSQKESLLLGILSLLTAAALFAAVTVCRKGGKQAPDGESKTSGSLLLLPPAALVIRLVLTYRLDSVNPVLAAYYVELLALVFLTLGFYRLSSFAYKAGRTRRFALYTSAAVVLCLAALADSGCTFPARLLYAGGAVTLLGFLLLRLLAPAPRSE